MFTSHIIRRATAAAVGAAALVVGVAGPAAAHVTVQPPEAEPGGYTKLSFRVPNECDTAQTVELSVSFPTETPFASVRVRPRQGWSAEVERETLPEPVEVGHGTIDEAVTSITWTSEEGAGIGPDEFEEFEVSVGPVPDAEQLAFPAVQTYDDGEVVAWDQIPEPDSHEPERPAPILTLTEAAGDGSGAGDAEPVPAGTTGESANEAGSTTKSDDTARALGAAGLVLGTLGLLAGAVAYVLARRPRGSSE